MFARLSWPVRSIAPTGRGFEGHSLFYAMFLLTLSLHSQAETWPATLALSPTREFSVSMTDLQAWMKRHKPVLCTFQAQPRAPDTKANEGHYRSLVQLLTVKNIVGLCSFLLANISAGSDTHAQYAVAGWTLPSGVHGNNVLVFPINGVGLVGAFFPLTGIPEMPKSSGGAMNVGGLNLPPQIVTQLQKLTPAQRNLVLAQFLRQRQQQQLQQQQQQQHQHPHQHQHQPQHQQMQQQQDSGGLVSFGLNAQPQGDYVNMSGLLGTLGSQAGAGGNSMNSMNLAQQGMVGTGLSRPVSGAVQGGIGGNVSYEILQSFMQRNPEGPG